MTARAIVPTFRRVDGDNPDSEVSKWLASIPDTFTAPQGRDAALSALADANARIAAVRNAYHGTLPPAPWPAPPELVKSMETMAGARDFFSRIAETKVDQKWNKASKAWLALSRAGVDLFDKVDHLEHASANAPTVAAMLKLVPDPRTMLFGYPKKTVALAAIGLWLFAPEVRTHVKRLLRKVAL